MHSNMSVLSGGMASRAMSVDGLMPVQRVFVAIEAWDVTVLRAQLDRDPLLINACDETGATPLMYACAHGNEPLASMLLDGGAKLDAQNGMGWTALMQAARQGHYAVVLLLIKAGANLHLTNQHGVSALGCAVRSGHISIVQVLLKGGAAVNMEPRGISAPPLTIAAKMGNEPVVRLLVAEGARLDTQCAITGWTALMFAALTGKLGIVQLLVGAGADVNLQTVLEATALDIASTRGHAAIEEYLGTLTSQQSAVRAVKLDIFEASKRGDYARVRVLLDDEPEVVDAADADGATPLMFAAMRGHEALAELLITRGANVDLQDLISGWTALMQATYYGHKGVARLLIDAAADINMRAKNGCTAFDIAAIIADTEVVRLLAAVNTRNPKSRAVRSNSSTGLVGGSEKSNGNRKLSDGTKVGNSSAGAGSHGESVRSKGTAAAAGAVAPLAEAGGAGGTAEDHGSTMLGGITNFFKRMGTKFRKIRGASKRGGGSSAVLEISQSPSGESTPERTPSPHDGGGAASSHTALQAVLNENDPFYRPNNAGYVGRDGPGDGGADSTLNTQQLGGSVHFGGATKTLLSNIKPPFLPMPAFELDQASTPMSRPPDRPRSNTRTRSHEDLYQQLEYSGGQNRYVPQKVMQSNASSVLAKSGDQGNTMAERNEAWDGSSSDGDSGVYPSGEVDAKEEPEITLLSIFAKLSLEKYLYIFEAQEIDATTFVTLTDEDLRELGISKMGPRKQLLGAIASLKNDTFFQKKEAEEQQALDGFHVDAEE